MNRFDRSDKQFIAERRSPLPGYVEPYLFLGFGKRTPDPNAREPGMMGYVVWCTTDGTPPEKVQEMVTEYGPPTYVDLRDRDPNSWVHSMLNVPGGS